jgi:phosphoglycerate dehydrogenase-like enzyme
MEQMKVILCQSGDYRPDLGLIGTLREKFPTIQFVDILKEEFSGQLETLRDAEVFVGWPTDDQLTELTCLRWIQLPSAGANGYTQRPALHETIAVTNSSGVFGVPGAEHAVALMLAFARQLPIHFDQQRRKVWKRNPACLEVQDATVGIIGLGDIGSEIAKRAKGLGAAVLAVKRSPTDCPPYVDQMFALNEIDHVLASSDFLVMALPLTEETHGFLDEKRIQRMKRGAIFINVGRGSTVDEAALIQALRGGRLGGAGLDVTDTEPLPEDSPLWELPNVLITSHSVGVSPRKEERRMKLLVQNLERYIKGEPLLNLVDRKAGY